MTRQFQIMTLAALFVVPLFAAQRASAVASLMLDDGAGNSITIVDNDANDLDGSDGVVQWSGSLGTWSVNLSGGISKPELGSAALPHMDLVSQNTSTAAGTMTIKFTDTDFTAPGQPGVVTSVGGTTNGIADFKFYLDEGNAAFGTGTLLTDLGPFNSSPFMGAQSKPLDDRTDDYSLTIVATLTHEDGRKVSSFDAELQSIPEPMTASLIGLGGLVLLARRRR